MRYYKVFIASMSFHGKEPLTYSFDEPLEVGSIVRLPLQNKISLGIIESTTAKPNFTTKKLIEKIDVNTVPKPLIELTSWLMSYYPAPSGAIVSMLIPGNIDKKSRTTSHAIEPGETVSSLLPSLTKEQSKIINQLDSLRSQPVLLHGDTGSGKTRVYIEQAKKSIDKGLSVLVLTPEIGLSAQLMKVFTSEFPSQAMVVHSKLTPAQRRDKWSHIASYDKPMVVIGPRSALFSPIRKLGLIVIDEAHDSAYKQDSAPYYQTTRVAAKLAQLHSASLILGSATPNIADYYTFTEKKLPILRMKELAAGQPSNTEVSVVSIKDRSNFNKSSWLSNQLIEKVNDSLNQGSQSLVFLNRRGSARVVMCQNCAWQAICPKCDIPLTYHQDKHRIICHTCGYKTIAPSSCPKCSSTQIEFRVIGTKALHEELAKIFPNAQVSRFDSDNSVGERIDQNQADIIDGKVDILVGTQVITKGLDLPRLAFVGVVAADTALSFPDYTAEEISFQQLSQVIGRVGRGHRHGSVVIQTYYSENLGLKAAVTKNYSLFYKQQIDERERFVFPPFCFTLKLVCSRKNLASAQKSCLKLHQWLLALPLAIQVSEPAPAFVQKQNNNFRWQIIVKSKKRSHLTKIIDVLPSGYSYDIDPSNLL